MTKEPWEYTDNIALGMKMLEDHLHLIDEEVLDVSSTKMCPVGQVYGNWWIGLNALKAPIFNTHEWSVERGFCAQDPDEYPALNEAWKRAISERRESE